MSDRCRSCGAAIEWVKTPFGRALPLDAESTSGNIRVDHGVAYVVKVGAGLRVSHFATCPQAAKHRKVTP